MLVVLIRPSCNCTVGRYKLKLERKEAAGASAFEPTASFMCVCVCVCVRVEWYHRHTPHYREIIASYVAEGTCQSSVSQG